MMKNFLQCAAVMSVTASILAVAACNPVDVTPTSGRHRNSEPNYGKVFGKDLVIYRAGEKDESDKTKEKEKTANAENMQLSSATNPFLWQASLEALAFMTIATAERPSGIIITDWYSEKSTANERFKFSLVIQGKEISPDNLRIRLFKQIRDKNNEWIDATADKTMVMEITNTIINRAKIMAQ